MPLLESVSMTFIKFDIIPAPLYPDLSGETGISIILTFECAQPGPGMPSLYSVLLSSTDISTINAATNKINAFKTVIIDQLTKQYRPSSPLISTLNGFLGQSVAI